MALINNYNYLLNVEDIEEPDEDDLAVLNFIQFGIPRQVRQRINYFDVMDDTTFRRRFRLSKAAVLNVVSEIEHRLEFPIDINHCVSPINQVLACLRIYSTGGHLDSVADFIGIHTSTVSRIVVKVSEAIAELYGRYIGMPNDVNHIQQTQQQFFNIGGFPRVIGTIDCTHFKIISPGENDPEIFRNRKGYFSLNAQFVCDAKLKVMNVVARWPGSTHDSTIYNNSNLKQNFEENIYRGSVLLGDSGYANKTYLLTPLLNPQTPAEHLYNESHIRTRNTVERMFGVLKRRFPILAYGCRLKLQTFMTIIIATSVLHNIAIDMGEANVPPLPEELNAHVLHQLIVNGEIPQMNNDARDDVAAATMLQLINDYFQNRI